MLFHTIKRTTKYLKSYQQTFWKKKLGKVQNLSTIFLASHIEIVLSVGQICSFGKKKLATPSDSVVNDSTVMWYIFYVNCQIAN